MLIIIMKLIIIGLPIYVISYINYLKNKDDDINTGYFRYLFGNAGKFAYPGLPGAVLIFYVIIMLHFLF